MRYLALATDFDGTLATDGQVDEVTLSALDRWQQSGRKLILITGRRLDDLLGVFAAIDRFDRVVTENGPVLYCPSDQSETLLSDPPPAEFVDRLREQIARAEQPRAVAGEFDKLVRTQGLQWLSIGRVIVATWVPHDVTAQTLIDDMGLKLQVIMNKGAVMVLPVGVDKASGLHAALDGLNLSLEQVIGVGDAENDLAFLKRCGYSVAVANALPAVQEQVDWVTTGSRGAGVVEVIDRFLSSAAPLP